MSTVALFIHGGRPDAIALGQEVSLWLKARRHLVVSSPREAELLTNELVTVELDRPDQPIHLVVSIGGDGTMLRATRRGVESGAEVLGINLGQLGYLAEVEPKAWEAALDDYFAGRHEVADRLLVSARVHVDGADTETQNTGLPLGLNEVVIEKQAMGRTVRLGVTIDGKFFTSYVADGLILATPTGSTAYSLSARGPIVDPSHRALILTPVSPHSLFDRSLVLEPTSVVEVSVLGDRPAAVSVDGEQAGMLPPGARVTITAADRPARFVTFGSRDFHQILKAKFGLSDR
ncbi:MAG: NAD(+)/NADH kinase [Aquihabitans sp.]